MCPCVPDRIGIWKCWFLRRGENRRTRRKTSRSKGENREQTQPTYGVDARIRSRAALVGGELPLHRATIFVWGEKRSLLNYVRHRDDLESPCLTFRQGNPRLGTPYNWVRSLTKGWFPLTRFWLRTLTHVNKIKARNKVMRLNVKLSEVLLLSLRAIFHT